VLNTIAPFDYIGCLFFDLLILITTFVSFYNTRRGIRLCFVLSLYDPSRTYSDYTFV